MDEKESNPIVADGQTRLRNTREYREQAARVRAEVRRSYEPQMSQSGPIRKLWLAVRMQREIRRELKKLAPGEALYISNKKH